MRAQTAIFSNGFCFFLAEKINDSSSLTVDLFIFILVSLSESQLTKTKKHVKNWLKLYWDNLFNSFYLGCFVHGDKFYKCRENV